MKFVEKIKISDRVRTRRIGPGGGRRGAPPSGFGPGGESNVRLRLIDPESGEVVEERTGHNIFIDYGRDWLAHLISLDTGYANFRDDRLRYMAFGIGGTSQLILPATIRGAHAAWAGYADAWGGVGAAGPAQTDTDPTITAMEWPVAVTSGIYYDHISAPATFPDTGVVRLTSVLGINEVSFGAFTSVPISEIGLFTAGMTGTLTGSPIWF